MKTAKTKEWLTGGSFTAVGLAFAIVSVGGLLPGINGAPWFEHTRGEQGVVTLGLMFLFAALLALVGIFACDSKERCQAAPALIMSLGAVPS